MQIIQMTFKNTQSILTKLLLNSKADVFFFMPGDRINILFHDTIVGCKYFAWVWSDIRQIRLLSHGQAFVEQGFSVNKQDRSR